MFKKHIPLVILLAALAFSCGKQGDQAAQGPREAKGGRFYGGIFKLNESEYIKSLFPHSIVDVYSYRVASQIYEGLFKFNQETLEVVEGLAESYTVDNTNTVYTIRLRKGVMFHDDPCFADGKGREMKAQDVLYAFTKLCTQSLDNQGFHVFDGVIKGAKAYYNASVNGQKPAFEIEGLKVLDEYSFQIILEKPNSQFKIHLARPETFIFPREAYEKYGSEMRIKAIGTGPFVLANVDENTAINLKRNPNYYRKDQYGNQLPFLDGLNIQFIAEKRTEFREFKAGKLDMMYRMPTDYIMEILEETQPDADGGFSKYPLQRKAETQTQIYSFLNQHPVFKDVNVRKAFSFAINRKQILDFVLNGEGYDPGLHGITPPAFDWYDIKQVRGYDFNRDSALYYIAKAGYPQGRGFPKITLDLNPEGERHTNVAAEVKRQLRQTLNIDIDINIIPHAEITNKCLTGDFSIIRLSWVADYPSPENFLWMFHSKYVPAKLGENSYPNIPRYSNPKFDALYDKALAAPTQEEAMKHFMEAENLMMADAPILVLWYDECYRLLQKHVKNFPNNPMQYRDFSEVYMEKESAAPTGEAAKK